MRRRVLAGSLASSIALLVLAACVEENSNGGRDAGTDATTLAPLDASRADTTVPVTPDPKEDAAAEAGARDADTKDATAIDAADAATANDAAADAGADAAPDAADAGSDARVLPEGGVTWSDDGGNGHTYATVATPQGITWDDARLAAISMGGHLVAFSNDAEHDFVFSAVVNQPAFWYVDTSGNGEGPWLGGDQPAGSAEPSGGWRWVTGEPFTYTRWTSGEPNNFSGNEDALVFFGPGGPPAKSWNDVPRTANELAFVVEFDDQTDTLLLDGGIATTAFGSAGNPAASCKALHATAPAASSGKYWVRPSAGAGLHYVYCDMSTEGGGWTKVTAAMGDAAVDSLLGGNGRQMVKCDDAGTASIVSPAFTSGWHWRGTSFVQLGGTWTVNGAARSCGTDPEYTNLTCSTWWGVGCGNGPGPLDKLFPGAVDNTAGHCADSTSAHTNGAFVICGSTNHRTYSVFVRSDL